MQIPDELLKTVAYVAYKDRKAEYCWAGSVFFVGSPDPLVNGRCNRVFAVTALHVIEGICHLRPNETIYLRVNLKTGGFKWIPTKLTDWHWIEGGEVDVAITERGIPPELDHLVMPFHGCCPVSHLASHHYGIGGDVYMIGLYVRQPGEEKNIPIARVGNIASVIPQTLKIRNYKQTRGILIEARSFGGLSGSPVFARFEPVYSVDGKTILRSGATNRLIGLVHGHHDLDIQQSSRRKKVIPKSALDKLNTGIAVVVPLEEIVNTIQSFEVSSGRPKLDVKY